MMPHMIVADSHDLVTDASTPRDRRLAAILLVLGFGLTVACGRVHPDGLVHFDDLTHYLFAKWAWTWPSYLLNDWGRPGFTIPYFLPAALGWPACKVLSAIMHAAAAWLAYGIAGRFGIRRAWAVIPLCYVQPLFFNLAQTTLTESPMALYVTASVYLALRARWGWSAAVMSLAFITRHEAVILAFPWAWCAWRAGVPLRRGWPLIWAPVAINVAAILAGVQPAIELLFAPRASTQYGRGGWLTFLCRSLEASGPGVMVLAIAGLAPLWRNRAARLTLAVALTYFLAHTAIRALGLYASGGYARFLVPIAPLVAVAALAGWNRLFDSKATERRRGTVALAAAMLILWASLERQFEIHDRMHDILAEFPQVAQARTAVRLATGLLVATCAAALIADRRGIQRASHEASDARRDHWAMAAPAFVVMSLIALAAWKLAGPIQPPPEAAIIRDTLTWLHDNGHGEHEIISSNVWIDYVTRRNLPPDRPTVREALAAAPIGALFAWENQFAASEDHRLPLSDFDDDPSWRLIHQSAPRPGAKSPYLLIFQKISDWPRPAPAASVAPALPRP